MPDPLLFEQLIDVPDLQKMADAHYRAAGIPIGIISAIDNSVIVGAGWQDICVHFHRANEESRRCCEISDNYIKKHLQAGEATQYKCVNGLWDIGVPIIVAEQHLATLFLGQFFYEDEIPDREFFEVQARKFNFDIVDYMEALDRVPIFSREKVDIILAYNMGLVGFISSLASRSYHQMVAEEALKEKQSQLQQTQKMEAIGTLAGGVAHDFNNILSAIIGFTELSLLQKDDIANITKNLEYVLSAAARAKDLTQQILMFSRKGDEQRQLFDVHTVVFEASQLLRKTIPSSISLHLDIDASTGTVMADVTQIHQVVMNLCTNAFHALPDQGGEISIGLTSVTVDGVKSNEVTSLNPGNYAQLTIADTGLGIEEDVLLCIYEFFFTTKDPGVGTGMGLSVVHGIVTNHGGDIVVSSAPGTGTTFKVFLPLVADSAADKELAMDDTETLRGSEHILFVDDEAILTELGKATLEAFGYQVTASTSSLEALSLFESDPNGYDLIVSDQTMPNMTGDVLATQALLIRPDIPIIICTGHSAIMDADKATDIGIKALLMKPLESRVLIREIRKCLVR
jgi:signal transduction histidine kinase/CheY-like chemotaxis protein